MYEGLKTAEHAVAAFAGMEKPPIVVISHDLKVEEDAKFASRVATYLRKRNINALTTKEFEQKFLLPGQDRDLEISKWAETCTHFVDIVSGSSRAESGLHREIRGETLARDTQLDKDKHQTRVFELTEKTDDLAKMKKKVNAKIMNSWDKDAAMKDFIIEMMAMGPGGQGYGDETDGTGSEKKIDWSNRDFAELLGYEVTVQAVTPGMKRYLDDPDRIQAVIIVSKGLETSHNETMKGAIEFKEEKQITVTDKPAIVCDCPKCGSRREAYFVDKAGEGTYGVAIIPNQPDESCGVTVNVSPVPGFTLQNALDDIFA